MATTYFGYCDAAGTPTGTDNININDEIYWATAGYACPDSGSQSVVDIGIYTSPGGNLRLGVYLTDGTLIVESDSEKTKDTITGWLLWTSAELTWHVGSSLTGGTTYVMAITSDTGVNIKGSTGRPADTISYASGDYTAGMPDPLPAHSHYTYEISVRVGVEPAAGGAATYSGRGIARGIMRGVGR